MSRFLLSLLLPCIFAAGIEAATPSRPLGHSCDGQRDRIITELFRHEQSVRQRGAALTLATPRAPLPDAGNIAIVDDSEGALINPNPFDLRGRTVRITPSDGSASRYTAASESLAFDDTAAQGGAALAGLQDDDSRTVRLPFAFPFYGQRHDTMYVNSDGNISFTRADGVTGPRTLARAISGPPRIFAFFEDLDPSRDGAVRFFAAADHVVLTWDGVPQYATRGAGPKQTFQVVLWADGRIEFHYREITITEAVVGIAPGQLRDGVQPADFLTGVISPFAGALAEVFSSTIQLDVIVVAQKFFRNHDDSYDYLVMHNNMGLGAEPSDPSTFAYLLHIRNRVRGIGGLLRDDPVFDFGSDFGSPARLQSFLNMGSLANYPANPNQVIPIFASSRNTPITIMGQESGHRFLAYPRFLDPTTGRPSFALLGRDSAHWSFFFNSDASVVEGNRIEDRGEGQSPRFVTTATVEHYGPFDQYLMGFRAPPEVPASFVVRNPSAGFAAEAPRAGVTFDGTRQDLTVQMIVDAEGRRIPDSTVSQRHFNYAFVLLVREGTQPSAGDLSQLERLRTEWERFFNLAVDNRAAAHTALVRRLNLSTWPAGGVLRGSPGAVTVSISSPASTPLTVLLSADNGAITAPASVTIAAGAASASFQITGNRLGVAELSAMVNDPAFDVARTRVQVREDAAQLRFETVSGSDQRGPRGGALPEPVVLRLRDENELPFSGVPVTFTASGDGAVTPARTTTDAQGLVRVSWRLASSGTANTLRAALDAASTVSATVNAAAADQPVLTTAGVVSAASFTGGIVPGGLVSIFGAALAGETRAATAFPLPTAIGSTTVTVGGIAAALLYISPNQLNIQVPFDVTGSSVPVVVSNSGVASATVTAPVRAAQPGIFFDSQTGRAAIVHNSDGVFTSNRPAASGDLLQIYSTGLGPVSPPAPAGFAAPAAPLSRTVLRPEVTIAGRPASVMFAGLAPGFAGLYQLTVQAPDGMPGGRQPVRVSVEGAVSNEVFIEVR